MVISALTETYEAKYSFEGLAVPYIYGQKSMLYPICLLIKALGRLSDSNLDGVKFAVPDTFG